WQQVMRPRDRLHDPDTLHRVRGAARVAMQTNDDENDLQLRRRQVRTATMLRADRFEQLHPVRRRLDARRHGGGLLGHSSRSVADNLTATPPNTSVVPPDDRASDARARSAKRSPADTRAGSAGSLLLEGAAGRPSQERLLEGGLWVGSGRLSFVAPG